MSRSLALVAAFTLAGSSGCAAQQVRQNNIFQISTDDYEVACSDIRAEDQTPYDEASTCPKSLPDDTKVKIRSFLVDQSEEVRTSVKKATECAYKDYRVTFTYDLLQVPHGTIYVGGRGKELNLEIKQRPVRPEDFKMQQGGTYLDKGNVNQEDQVTVAAYRPDGSVSSLTTIVKTIIHEVGHALGLDDNFTADKDIMTQGEIFDWRFNAANRQLLRKNTGLSLQNSEPKWFFNGENHNGTCDAAIRQIYALEKQRRGTNSNTPIMTAQSHP